MPCCLDLRRISSLCRNHSQRVSKYSLAGRTVSSHRTGMKITEHRPSWSFKQRQLNQAITITPRLTKHANIFLNSYTLVVFSHLSLQPLLPVQGATTATIRSLDHFEHVQLPLSLYCDVAFTRCE